jgi:molybdate transport system substrate-binding protein
MKLTKITVACTVAAALALTGCSSSKSSDQAATTAAGGSSSVPASSSAPALTGSITVFAASSLTGTFNELGKSFMAAHPGVTVTFNYGSSGTLSTQITQGAPADVFASAAIKNMQTVVDASDAATPTNFVKNKMEIAVPTSNPAKITALSDLAKPGVKLALCVATAPCGATADTVFANAKLTVKPVTREADAKTTISKVILGDADAAVVYVTDVKAATGVTGIEIPADVNATTEYPIATLTHAANPTVAAAFVAYVLSSVGQGVLTAAGFSAP